MSRIIYFIPIYKIPDYFFKIYFITFPCNCLLLKKITLNLLNLLKVT